MALHSAAFRDSTQIVLPVAVLEGVRTDLETRFTFSVAESDDRARIIASPTVIKDVSAFLARRGVAFR